MKKYKVLKKHTIDFTIGEIRTDGNLFNSQEDLSIEKLIEKGIIEEVKEDWKRWRAEIGERYYNVSADGEIEDFSEGDNKWNYYKYITGNYFQTREQAQQKLDRDLAIVSVNNRIRELQGGEVSREEMMDIEIYNWEIFYNVYDKKYDYSCSHNYFLPILLPIRTKEISQQIIKECKDDLDIIWGIK